MYYNAKEYNPAVEQGKIQIEKLKTVKLFFKQPLWYAILVFSLIVGCLIGYAAYEKGMVSKYQQAMSAQAEEIRILEYEKSELESDIDELGTQIVILSNTVTKKTAVEVQLTETLEAQSIPSAFPITGNASIEIDDGEIPACIFTASQNTTVVATASGVVNSINESDGNHVVVVNHGNGYSSIYCNAGDVMVKEGDMVSQGTTLFLIGKKNTTVVYQMMNGEDYVNPLDVMEING